jgi:hypothetical protein
VTRTFVIHRGEVELYPDPTLAAWSLDFPADFPQHVVVSTGLSVLGRRTTLIRTKYAYRAKGAYLRG